MDKKKIIIDESLVSRLITSQFPQWQHLPVRPVALSGWDNRTFHLGEHMLVRMPSAEDYALQVKKEHQWLPILAQHLPFPIPEPLALGQPEFGYPWHWSIYRWLAGDTAASASILHLDELALDLARFLSALEGIDASEGPAAGPHSFYRGGSLKIYDAETRNAIVALKDRIDVTAVTDIWESALAMECVAPPVWVHGDISAGNLLVRDGRLSGVIDFGQLNVGDPACDLAIAWTLFKDSSRKVFRDNLALDAGTWMRGRGWTLWKALITAAGITEVNNVEAVQCWRIIEEVIRDYRERE